MFLSTPTTRFIGVFLSLVLQVSLISATPQFQLVEDYSGNSFFDRWDFYGGYDNTTNGQVFYAASYSDAMAKKTAMINGNGNAIIRVDNFTQVVGVKRESVRITSQRTYDIGSLIITDMLHIPFGCGVWPSFWTTNMKWPYGGEIDIVEGVNKMTSNQMALHADPGQPGQCLHSAAAGSQLGISNPKQSNCRSADNSGCTVSESQPNSYGPGFAQNGGGVYAMQYDVSGIFIWFWPRQNIPQSIKGLTSTSSLDSIDDWGKPSASYASSNSSDGCDIPTFFSTQNIVIDITLCGDWAGDSDIYATSGCPTSAPPQFNSTCYSNTVVGPPSGFDDAFFEIQWVRSYALPGSPAASVTSTPTSDSQTGQTGGTSSTTTNKSSAKHVGLQWSLGALIIFFWLGLNEAGH